MDIYYGKSGPAYKLYFHLVFVTKFREPVFNKDNQSRMASIIKVKCKEKRYYIQSMAIQKDHIHLLLSLRPTDSISEVVKHIKGFSSFSFNKLYKPKLVWQTGYSVSTVSEDAIPAVKKYIEAQQEI